MADDVKSPIETSLINDLIERQSNLTGGQPAAWVMFNNDLSRTSEHLRTPCHMAMALVEADWVDTVITAMPNSDELSMRYQEWLIRGPFRAYSDKITLEQHGAEWIIRCSNCDQWPANVLYNYCIATRTPFEKRDYLLRWDSLLKKGINENLAFVLASYYMPKSPTYFPGHFWLDPTVNIRTFVSGEMDSEKVASQSYKANPRKSTPTNSIWGVLSEEDRNGIKDKTPTELMDYFGLKPAVIQEPPKDKVILDVNQAVHQMLTAMAAGHDNP